MNDACSAVWGMGRSTSWGVAGLVGREEIDVRCGSGCLLSGAVGGTVIWPLLRCTPVCKMAAAAVVLAADSLCITRLWSKGMSSVGCCPWEPSVFCLVSAPGRVRFGVVCRRIVNRSCLCSLCLQARAQLSVAGPSLLEQVRPRPGGVIHVSTTIMPRATALLCQLRQGRSRRLQDVAVH